jgi:hypothetical protein
MDDVIVIQIVDNMENIAFNWLYEEYYVNHHYYTGKYKNNPDRWIWYNISPGIFIFSNNISPEILFEFKIKFL